jgi:hypothetical protein
MRESPSSQVIKKKRKCTPSAQYRWPRLQMAMAALGGTTTPPSCCCFFFSCSGTAMRPGNIAAAATRVDLRRRMRARQRRSATKAARKARPPRRPPVIAAIFFEDEPPCVCEDATCVEESPGTAVCVVVGVAGAARVPGPPALTSVASREQFSSQKDPSAAAGGN